MTTDQSTQQRRNSSTIVDTANDVLKIQPLEQKISSSSHSFITMDDAMSFDSYGYSNSHSEPLTLPDSLRIQACQEFQQIMKLYKKKNKKEDSNDDNGDNDDDNITTMDFDGFTQLLQDLNYPKMEKVRELFNQFCDEIHQAEQQEQKQNEADDCKETEKREEHTKTIIGENDLRLLYDFSLSYSQKRCISQEFIDTVNEIFELSTSCLSSNEDDDDDDNDDDRNSQERRESILKELFKRRFSMTAGEFLDKVQTTDVTKRSNNNDEIHNVLNVSPLNKHEFLNVVFNGLDQITNNDTYNIPGKNSSKSISILKTGT